MIYLYTVSVLVMTFRRGSDVHFVRAGESAVGKGMAYTGSISTNLGGGKDVTAEVVAALTGA